MYSDMHVHSSASCDSNASIWDICETAIERGIEAVALTEHVELHPNDLCYGKFNYDAARRTFDRAKEKYEGRLTLLFGAEVTYRSEIEGLIGRFLESHRFDVVIGSLHDAPPINFWDPANSALVRSNPALAKGALKVYYREVKSMAATGLFDIVGHLGVYQRYMPNVWPDVVADNELSDILHEALEEVCANSRLELNSNVMDRPGHLPSPPVEVLKIYREMGGKPPTFGSDAHSAEAVGKNYSSAEKVLRAAGFSRFASWKDVARVSY